MKPISLLSLLLLLIASQILAQVPNGFKYQAVLRDNTGNLINNQNVSLRLSILSDTLPETIAYSEIHSTSTSSKGLINLTLGRGNIISGVFSEIDWGNAQHFLKIEFDANGGTNYQLMGISPFLSVPYTFLANKVINFSVEGQNLSLGTMTGNSNDDADGNTFIGYGAGKDNQLGKVNTFIGRNAGRSNTDGERNVLLGSSAGYYNTTGYDNVFLGTNAGVSNSSGSHNIFIGSNTGYNNTTGLYNTFIGKKAGNLNTTASNNTLIGIGAGENTTIGNKNTFLGNYAGYDNAAGFSNTYVGFNAGKFSKDVFKNTYLGEDAGSNNLNGSSNVAIGYQAGMNATESNKLYIANGADSTQNLIVGNFHTGEVTVKGIIESKSGGIKFPDGTTQTTAATPSSFNGTLVTKSTFTLPHNQYTSVAFTTKSYDEGNIWSSQNSTRLTIPAGVSYVRIEGYVWFNPNNTDGSIRSAQVRRNDTDVDKIHASAAPFLHGNKLTIISPVLAVTPGDYFELVIYQNSGQTVDLTYARLSLEVVK